MTPLLALVLLGQASNWDQLQSKDPWPIDVGQTWRYHAIYRNAEKRSEFYVNWKVSRVNDTGKSKRVVIDITSEELEPEQQVWEFDKTGAYQIMVGNPLKQLKPRLPVALWPPTPGKTFSWTGKGIQPWGGWDHYSFKSTIKPPEMVDTPEGQMKAVVVHSKVRFAKRTSGEEMLKIVPGLGVAYQRISVEGKNPVSLVFQLVP
jgi:hypothetical protein